MYKITLYDYNCSPIADGVTSFFVDEIEEFEKHWLEERFVEKERKERYLRSKNGEIVTDYHTNNEEYNIVQKDKTMILSERQYLFFDKVYRLSNFYGDKSYIYAKHGTIQLRYIKFKNKYYLIGKYCLKGVCREQDLIGVENRWVTCSTYGNPIFKEKHTKIDIWTDREGQRRRDYSTDKFEEDEIETYCWVTIGVYDKKNDFNMENLKTLPDNMVEILMQDIPGEAG